MTTVYPNPTLWGATRTTTFTTTTTATIGQVIFFIFPTLTTPQSFQYTTLPSPTSPFSKDYPGGLPILVLTQVNGIIVDPSGQILTTATIVQTAPTSPTSPNRANTTLVPGDSAWRNWTPGQKGGVIAAIVFSVLGLIGVILLLCRVRRQRNKMERDMETDPRENRGRARTRTRKKEEHVGPRGIADLAGVELGPAAMRSVQANVSTAQQRRRSGNRMGGSRTDPSLGRNRPGVRYQMSGALQGDDNLQRVPVGQRPSLPPNQQYLPRTEPAHVDPGPGAPPPVRSIRSEARRADRARH